MCAPLLPCGQFGSYEIILFFRGDAADKRPGDQVVQDVEGLEDLEQGRCGRSPGEIELEGRSCRPPRLT
jgi:hypothetical protein